MHIYLEIEPERGLFNYRGESGDYASFKEKMAKSGLRVIATEEFKGDRRVPLKVLEDK